MEKVGKEWLKIFSTFSEAQKRWVAGIISSEIGHGGVNTVSSATGLSKTTIIKGKKEVKSSKGPLSLERIRNEGGGRKKLYSSDNTLIRDISAILDETTAGDPMSTIRWTGKSVRKISEELSKRGHSVCPRTVYSLLKEMDYSLQSNKKSLSRENNPERDRQFKMINRRVKRFLHNGLPVISVDTKKKEIVGNFKNQGETWRKKGEPLLVEDHDFPSRGKGKAIPYGTYDVGRNEGLMNIGISTDTAEFAVNSILRWWNEFGERNYPKANELLICADGGGSNGSNNRLWKYCLQRFADKMGLEITVSHYPPGTSKWNKIEHRMFSYISSHWRGQPLESYESIIKLIGSTTTRKGLKVKAKLDKRAYKKGKKISDEDFSMIKIVKNRILPKWNYTILPL